jgi:transposase
MSLTQASRELDIDVKMLRRWKRELEGESTPVPGEPSREEYVRVCRELQVKSQELEILKKAVGIFSQQPR